MKTLSASPTVTLNGIAARKRMLGERVYNFAAGDPVLNNHSAITKRAVGMAEKGCLPYPPVEGITELRTLAANWMNATCGTQFAKDHVLVAGGGKFAIFAIIYSLLQPNEEVLIPAPYWVSYPEIVKMAGGIPKIVMANADNQWKITPQNLLQHITKNSKMLILNNACNPTGALYTKQEVAALLAVAKKFGLLVISDEVYSGLVYDEPGFVSCGAFPEHQERVLIVQSCSKNFGMTGWRVGFALGPEHFIKRLAVLQSQSTTGVSTISQWAAVGAMENAAEVNAYVKEAMRKRRDQFVHTYNSLFPIPLQNIKSALYAFVPMASMGVAAKDSAAFSEQLLERHNIALVPGVAFGVEGYVRFAFSEPEEEIYQGLHELKKTIGGMS